MRQLLSNDLKKILVFVMARLRPGHPRLSCRGVAKTWMPGTRPGMTSFAKRARAIGSLAIQTLKMRTAIPHLPALQAASRAADSFCSLFLALPRRKSDPASTLGISLDRCYRIPSPFDFRLCCNARCDSKANAAD
jgi:hypothetical protein